MSFNLSFQYVRDLLAGRGPLSEQEVTAVLTQFRPGQVADILAWAVANGSLTLDNGVYALTERGWR